MKQIFIIYLLSTLCFFGQDNLLKKADKLYKTASYSKAASMYKEILQQSPKNIEVLKKAADCYYFTSNFEEAKKLYSKFVTINYENIDEKYIFRYAQSLYATGDSTNGKKWMQEYLKEVPSTVYKANLDKLENIKKKGSRFRIKNEVFNTKFSDFGVAYYNDKIIYSSPRERKGLFERNYTWTDQAYLDLYEISYKNGIVGAEKKPFSTNLNSKLHEASVTFTNDGKTIYFTRNISEKGKRKKDNNNTTNLAIYKADLVEGEWKNITLLPFNSVNYSVMHPALNKDNTKLFFSSDMPGSIGSYDIFYVDIDANGNYGKPINLGNEINTKNREQFPYISSKGNLYFSSDGHVGFGLLDNFVSEYRNETFYVPQNLGLDANSAADDFSFIIDEEKSLGFFASNRPNGIGDDDVYSYTIDPKLQENESLVKPFEYFVEGKIVNKETNRPIEGAVIAIYNSAGEKISDLTLDEYGSYKLPLKPDTYIVKSTHPNYIPAEKTITVLDNGRPQNDALIEMNPIPKTFLEKLMEEEGNPKLITDNGVLMFNLPEILFDYNKFDIKEEVKEPLNKLVDKLKRYPQINIEIGSHTDIRGKAVYNEYLSQQRANSTKQYLVENGIDSSRLTAKGFGENKPKVNCEDHKCSEEEHQINRRSEFLVIINQKQEE